MDAVGTEADLERAGLLQAIRGYRRRLWTLALCKVLVWTFTILFIGIVSSRLMGATGGVIVTAVGLAGMSYRLRGDLDLGMDRVAVRVDRDLSLKEGLITAYQYRNSREPMAHLLLRRTVKRLADAAPSRVFPWRMPRVLWTWPLLLIIVPMLPDGQRSAGPSRYPMSSGPAIEQVSDADQSADRVGRAESKDIGSASTRVRKSAAYGEVNRQTGMERKGLSSLQEGVGKTAVEKVGNGMKTAGPTGSPMGSAPVETGEGHRDEGAWRPRPDGASSEAVSGHPTSPAGGKGARLGGTPSLGDKAGRRDGQRDGDLHHESVPLRASVTEVTQILLRRDIPEEYKAYIRRYFDTIQQGEGIGHGP